MAGDPQLVDVGGHLLQGGDDVVENGLALGTEVRLVAVEEHGAVEGEINQAVALADRDLGAVLTVAAGAGGVGLEKLVELLHGAVHLRGGGHAAAILLLPIALGASGGVVRADQGGLIEALDNEHPLLLVDGGHGVEQDEEAQQQGDHVAVSVHPVGAALAASLFLF